MNHHRGTKQQIWIYKPCHKHVITRKKRPSFTKSPIDPVEPTTLSVRVLCSMQAFCAPSVQQTTTTPGKILSITVLCHVKTSPNPRETVHPRARSGQRMPKQSVDWQSSRRKHQLRQVLRRLVGRWARARGTAIRSKIQI